VKVDEFLGSIEKILLQNGPRTLIGIVGKPGIGKSTLVERVKAEYPGVEVSTISLDGYHLSNETLETLGARGRKGAPDTFDYKSFVELLRRVKSANQDIRFPIFHREIEASVADEGVVPAAARVVIVEGNYLLSTDYGWGEVADLLDFSYYLELQEDVRLERLIERHVRYGKSPEAAREWAMGTDESNARFIERTRSRATGVIEIPPGK
jgi:pantothenate kinase